MTRAVPFSMVYLTAATVLAGAWLEGWVTWLTPVVVFGLVPVADLVIGVDEGDPSDEGGGSIPFDALLFAWVPTQLILLGVVLWKVGSGTLAGFELLGLVVSTALATGGGGINVAHELMHRAGRLPRALAEVLMTTATYPHFCVEHVLGHHRHVGTPADPATARLGESVYTFVPRSVVGGLRSAWRLEGRRTARRGIPWWSLRDRRLRHPLAVALTYAAVGVAFGGPGVLFFAAQSAGAVLLLEVINYIEHYGLERARSTDGGPERYERVAPRHSWNANQRVTNWWLFNLQRHADHHANASRPYYRLRAMVDGPQLPTGYAAMVVIALVPPLWRRIMDPRVEAVRRGYRRAA